MSRNFCRLNGNVWRIFSKGEAAAEVVMRAIEKAVAEQVLLSVVNIKI
jgi:hypothetical protein